MFIQYEPSRIILTHCRDLTVRFADISSQLLFPEQHAPLCKPFPNPYPHLTIDLKTLFLNHRVVECTSADILEGAAIENVHLARDSFDLCISLRTGECFVYRLSERSAVSTARASDDVELILLDHVVLPNKTDYQPYLMLAPKRGPLLDVALSEIGMFYLPFVLFDDGRHIQVFWQPAIRMVLYLWLTCEIPKFFCAIPRLHPSASPLD